MFIGNLEMLFFVVLYCYLLVVGGYFRLGKNIICLIFLLDVKGLLSDYIVWGFSGDVIDFKISYDNVVWLVLWEVVVGSGEK